MDSFRRLLFISGIAAQLLLMVGCDAVRRGHQQIKIRVSHPQSDLAMQNVSVAFVSKEKFAHRRSRCRAAEAPISQFSKASTVTDADGHAAFQVPISVMRGGLLVWLRLDPIRLEDRVSGREYLFRLGDEAGEVLSVRMDSGVRVEGDDFALTVVEIGPPLPDDQ